MLDALNKLCKWRSILAGWHLGSKGLGEPGVPAMRDLMDKWLVMRCENTALTALLIERKLFTAEEFTQQVLAEAAYLDKQLELQFPGFAANEEGIEVYDIELVQETMARLNFPP